MAFDIDDAVEKIDEAGILLVFPIKNQKEPPSLWSAFYPRTKMRWEWDDNGDGRVGDLWHLRTELSESRDVVYAKWYTGRATLFSRPMFSAMLAALKTTSSLQKALIPEAQTIIETLDEDSPQSPRILRETTGLLGKYYASTFEKALRDLWSRLLIVGFGEIEDGAFPSLAVGSTRMLFEELWEDACALSPDDAMKRLTKKLGDDSLFIKYLARVQRKLT